MNEKLTKTIQILEQVEVVKNAIVDCNANIDYNNTVIQNAKERLRLNTEEVTELEKQLNELLTQL